MPSWSELEVFFSEPVTITRGYFAAFLGFVFVWAIAVNTTLSRLYADVSLLKMRDEINRLAGRPR